MSTIVIMKHCIIKKVAIKLRFLECLESLLASKKLPSSLASRILHEKSRAGIEQNKIKGPVNKQNMVLIIDHSR